MAFASHENVVRFQAVSHWSSYVAIIMQYEVRGSLHQLLKNRSVTSFPYKLRYRMAYEIAKALVFLHNFGVDERMVHGDLKSSNVLLTEDLRARVADFGAAHIGTKTCDQTRHQRPPDTLVHSVVFTAPEFLQNIYTRRTTAMDVFRYASIVFTYFDKIVINSSGRSLTFSVRKLQYFDHVMRVHILYKLITTPEPII